MSAPSPLDLLELVRAYVAEMADLLPTAAPAPEATAPPADGADGRTYELLELTDELEIWAIHWPKDRGLELHDHGGSSGAMWVVSGALEEHSIADQAGLVHRRIGVGSGTAFGPTYIHDVVNAHDAPATSVHVYSPPMASMTFYRQAGDGLRVERAEYRADPTWAP
jgi:hypothetical protein